jgi:hypothetical protein
MQELVPPLPSQTQPFDDLAVDSSGAVYVVYGVGFGIFEYHWNEPNCSPMGSRDAGSQIQTRALAADAVNNLYAYQSDDSVPIDFITRYDAAGAVTGRYGYDSVSTALIGLAARGTSGELFGSERNDGQELAQNGIGNKILHMPPPPAGPIIVPSSVRAEPVSNTKATLLASINAEGEESTYHFEYVDEETHAAEIEANGPGHGFDSAVRVPADAAEDSVFGSAGDFSLHNQAIQIGCPNPTDEAALPGSRCLVPETAYRFRVLAQNDGGGGNGPIEGEFTTRPPLEIGSVWSTDVGPDSARLHAEVNPLGIPTTGYFELVDESSFMSSGFAAARRTGEVVFGSGEELQAASVFVEDLVPGSYRFRVVADDPLIDPIASSLRSFTTLQPSLPLPGCANQRFRTGAGAFLPNCRAYEMVSPVDKENGDVIAIGNINSNPAELNQSAAMGGKLTFSSYRAFGDAKSAPFTSQYFATRFPNVEDQVKEGWESQGISPARGINILFQGATLDTEFKVFSDDLCASWLRHDTDPVLASGAIEGFANLYERANCGPRAGDYGVLTTIRPPTHEAVSYAPEVQGISGDGSRIVFRVDDALTGNANPGKPIEGSNVQCYESIGGSIRLVSVLPNGTASKQNCSIGTAHQIDDGRSDSVSNAVSDDGTRIFWTASSSNAGPGQIYVRIKGTNPTVAVSESVSKREAHFWTAAQDGSRAIFTIDDGTLMPGDDLYEFNVDSTQAKLIAHGVEGLMGASDDANRIFFVSRTDLDDGASPGMPNLYLHEGAGGGAGDFEFIATLAESDLVMTQLSPVSVEPFFRASRVTSNGRHAVFMSRAAPTGYDNLDAGSGEPDAEVFLYDAPASAGDDGRLVCISCNPTGARPDGRELLRNNGLGTGLWAAAQIPGFESQLYASRILAEDGGHLFFESYEALVVRDTNRAKDVYQWERGSNSRECEGRGAELFVQGAGGCLSLISSGESGHDAEFIDASVDGTDVFVATDSSLLPQDPGLIDIYDARIGGGFPQPPPVKAPCEGAACQSPPPPPSEVTPASAVFHGKGNVRPRPKGKPRRCARGKRKVKRRGRSRCAKVRKVRVRRGHVRRGGRRR